MKEIVTRRYWVTGVFFFVLLVLSSCSYRFYEASPYPVAGGMRKVAELSDSVYETSGLAHDSVGHILTFNDSGGEAALYKLDRHGDLLAKTIVANAENADWEAMCTDEAHIYVADVGNNTGRRDTVGVYKIKKSSLSKALVYEDVEQILFSYDEETERNERGMYSHDCESIFAYGDSLYLFAKDWVKMETRVYVLPKKAGYYRVKARVSYSVNALVTGADISQDKKEVVLIGYRNFMPVVIRYHFENLPEQIMSGGKARIYPLRYGTQTEGIMYDEDGNVVVSAEKSKRNAAIYSVLK